MIRKLLSFIMGEIDAIVNLGAVFVCAGSFTFQLILRFAMLADVVFDRGICFGPVYGVFAADGAVHVAGEPVFRQHSRNLCGAFVASDQGSVES